MARCAKDHGLVAAAVLTSLMQAGQPKPELSSTSMVESTLFVQGVSGTFCASAVTACAASKRVCASLVQLQPDQVRSDAHEEAQPGSPTELRSPLWAVCQDSSSSGA